MQKNLPSTDLEAISLNLLFESALHDMAPIESGYNQYRTKLKKQIQPLPLIT